MSAYRTNARGPTRDREVVSCIVALMITAHVEARMVRAGPLARQQHPVCDDDRALYAAAVRALQRVFLSDFEDSCVARTTLLRARADTVRAGIVPDQND